MENLEAGLARIKGVLGVKTDKQMCEALDIPYGTLDTWKRRNNIPKSKILDIAQKIGVNMDTLVKGSFNQFGFNNSQNFGTIISNSPAKESNEMMQEFVELFNKYGNAEMLNGFIEKLKKIEKISKGEI